VNIEIADKLVKLRREKRMSQEDVAERLGVSRQAVSRWERAESSPDMDNLVELSKLYGISLDDLLDTDITQDSNRTAEPQSNKKFSGSEEKPDTVISQIPFPFVIPVFIIWGMFGFHEGYNWLGKHKPNALQRFPFPIIIAAVFLAAGFLLRCWHPCWVIFLTIPVYYVVAALIKRK
jgi:transcriptional regulator with XRE-family HTH domain